MSAWSWVARIGGYAAAPYTGGASIPIGESVAQGLEQQDANNKTNTQLQAGNNAAIETTKQAYAPYANLGGQAASNLSTLMGFSPLPTTAQSTVAPAADPYATRVRPDDAPIVGHAQARGTAEAAGMGSLADLGQQVQSRAQTRSSFVRMRSKEGDEEMDVPASQVEHFLGRGGTVVA